MANKDDLLNDFHWVMDILQFIDAGLVVLDKEYNIRLWNAFMQNHSAVAAEDVLGKNLFKHFPEISESWFRRKAESVFSLHNSAFTTWEQRPYIFKFQSYRPITSVAEFMYQNSTFIPLKDTRGRMEHLCLIIYDVTEVAVNRLESVVDETIQASVCASKMDPRTGLINEPHLLDHLELYLKETESERRAHCLLSVHVNHSAQASQSKGSLTKENIQKEMAKLLTDSVRGMDMVAIRNHGDFAVLLVDTMESGAYAVAERIRKYVATHTVAGFADLTISIGISATPALGLHAETWLDQADQALSTALDTGADKSIIF